MAVIYWARFSTAIFKEKKKKTGRNRVCAMHLLTSSALAYSLALYFLVSLSSIIVIYEMRRPFEERKKKL
jgi:hypothetical protein